LATARVFKSGNSQAVRLPKEFRFNGKEVDIFRKGDEVVLREKEKGMERAFWLIANLPINVDAIEQARKELPQERDGLVIDDAGRIRKDDLKGKRFLRRRKERA
jgi:antitoxin VapB